MLYIDFCRSPKKGFWVGCVEYNNGRAFASGRTMDLLVSNMKAMVNRTWGISAINVILSSRQMEAGEFEQKHMLYASKKFKGKFWNEKTETELIKTTNKSKKRKRVVVDGVLYDSISEAERATNMKQDTIGQALRHNQTMCMGHSIAYADELPQFKIQEPVKVETTKTEYGAIKNTGAKYSYEEKNGVLYVYERKLVAKYEIEKQ